MASIRLDDRQEAELTRLAAQTGRTKSYYIKQALDAFLEDRADYLLALAALERREGTVSLDEARGQLGLSS